MLAERKSLYVLEYEMVGVELVHNANEILDERVAWIVESALPNKGEALTRSASAHDIDLLAADARRFADLFSRHLRDGARDHRTIRKIEFMNRSMHRVDFDGCDDVETCLLEPKTESASAGEKIDCYGPRLGCLHDESISL